MVLPSVVPSLIPMSNLIMDFTGGPLPLVVADPPYGNIANEAHAARKLGRRFVVVEQDPENFDKLVASLR